MDNQETKATVNANVMTQPQWKELGKRLFGDKMGNWKFKCPACKNEASPNDWVASGRTREEARNAPAQCIKRGAALQRGARRLKKSECDWCAGGLFSGPNFVVDGGTDPDRDFNHSDSTPCFAFAGATDEMIQTVKREINWKKSE